MERSIVRVRAPHEQREDGHRRDVPDMAPTPRLREGSISLEALLWGLLLALAGALRLGDLGRWPLNAAEAEIALAALGRALPAPVPVPADVSPLAFNLTALSMWLFGPEDGVVRLPAALAGVALVGLLLWRGRDVLGRGPALGAAALLALSPSHTFFSRQATEVSVATLAALWAVFAVARYARRPSPGRAWEVTAALALGLVSGPGFWSAVVAGGLYALHARHRFSRRGDRAWLRLLALSRRMWPRRYRLLAGLAGAALFLSTAGWANPSGLTGALELPDRWLSLLAGSGPPPVIPFSEMAFLYEWPVFVWATLGAALWVERRPELTRFLLLWAFVTFLPATLTNTGWTGALAHVTLPLALLGGVALNALARGLLAGRKEAEGLYTATGLVILAFAWLNLVAYSLTGATLSILLVAAALVLAGSVPVVVAVQHGLERAMRVAGALLLVTSAFWALRTAWGLGYHGLADPREPLVTQAADPDVRYLRAFLRQVSQNRAGHPDRLPIAVQRSLGPVPRWYLRDFQDVRLTEGSHPGLPAVALLAPDEPAPPGHIGQRVRLGRAWRWPGLSGRAFVRWVLFREAPGVTGIDAILYVSGAIPTGP